MVVDIQEPDLSQHVRKADEVDKLVANRVKRRRREIGMSQRDLAQAIGVSYQQIQKYESGANRISAGRLFMIAKCIGLPVSSIFDSVPEEYYDHIPLAPSSHRAGDLDSLADPTLRQAFKGLLGALIDNQDNRSD